MRSVSHHGRTAELVVVDRAQVVAPTRDEVERQLAFTEVVVDLVLSPQFMEAP